MCRERLAINNTAGCRLQYINWRTFDRRSDKAGGREGGLACVFIAIIIGFAGRKEECVQNSDILVCLLSEGAILSLVLLFSVIKLECSFS